MPACGAPVAEGMVVHTDTDEVRNARRTALELLLGEHVGDCMGPCHVLCPATMDIPRMLRQIAAGDLRAAAATVKADIKKDEVPDLTKRIETTVRAKLKGKSTTGYGDRRMLAYKDFDKYFSVMNTLYNFDAQTPRPRLVESAKKAGRVLRDLGLDVEAAGIR